MANRDSQSVTVRLVSPGGQPDPTRLIWAIRGICRTIDQTDLVSMDWAESDRVSELVGAAAILADQLAKQITLGPVRRKRAAAAA